jgi:TolB protein
MYNYLRYLLVLSLFFVALTSTSGKAYAIERIKITSGNFSPVPIAVPDFESESLGLGRDVHSVIVNDLQRSGLFKIVNSKGIAPQVMGADSQPDLAVWKATGAEALVTATVNSGFEVQVRVWDVPGQKQLIGKNFRSSESAWRSVSHKVADTVYSALTGETGYFDSRIAYVAESGSWNKRITRLAIMDSDGENNRFLTDGSNLVLTPRFDPKQQRLTYFSFEGKKKPSVYIYDLETGSESRLIDMPGMTFSPRFSADGNKLAMTVENRGNSDIYVYDIASRGVRRITTAPSIETSPSFSPDNSNITYTSDAGGRQQIYVMNADGSGQKRISFGGGDYSTPVWSPRGDYIAFTKMTGGQFYIGIIRPDGSGEKLLTGSFLDEGPSWSPNGRVLIFNRGNPSSKGRPGGNAIYTVDITGNFVQRIDTPTSAIDPSWSPTLNRGGSVN